MAIWLRVWSWRSREGLVTTLTAELAAARVPVPVAIETAVVARCFERPGDHAVNVTRQLQHAGLDPIHGGGADR
jgi:phosphate uptake regulator